MLLFLRSGVPDNMRFQISLAIIVLACVATAYAQAPLPDGIIAVTPKKAPEILLKNMDDEPLTGFPARDTWTFVHFWASWCGPCKREMPAISGLIKHFRKNEIRIILVNTSEDDEAVFAFLGGIDPDMKTYMDRDGQVTEKWAPRGLPATYLVDPEGVIRYQALGGRNWLQDNYLEFLHSLTRGSR